MVLPCNNCHMNKVLGEGPKRMGAALSVYNSLWRGYSSGRGGQGALEMVSIILTSVRRLPLGKEKIYVL